MLSVNKEFQLDELDRFYYFHDKRYRKRKNSVLYLFYRKTRSAISKFINMVISFVYKKEIGLDFMKKDNQFSKKDYIEKINMKCKMHISKNSQKTNFILP